MPGQPSLEVVLCKAEPMLTWTGRVRASVYFSILDSERPQVKERLEAKLQR